MRKCFLSFVVLLFCLIVAACGNEQAVSSDLGEQQASNETTGDAEQTRVVQHARGEKEIPASPQRIAVINVVAFEDNLLALGVKPDVVPVFTWSEQGYLPYLAEQLAGTNGIDGAEPNLEQLLTYKPDLILIEERHADAYEQFERIAPTVIVSSDPDWRVRLRHLAELVNKSEEADNILAEYDQSVSASREAIQSSDNKGTVVLANLQDLKKIRVQGTVGHAVNHLFYDELALTPADGVPKDEARAELSLEGFVDLDPDYVFVQKNRSQTADEMMAQLRTEPLIANMRAFLDGHVYIVEDMLTKSWGIEGRRQLVEVIDQAMNP